MSSNSVTTTVIIGVTASIGSVLLIIVLYRVWRWTRGPKAPLPPKGPLARDRQRHTIAAYSQSDLQSPLPIIRAALTVTENVPYGDHSRQTSSQTDVASIPPSSPSVVSSQTHLVQAPFDHDESPEIMRGRRPSINAASTVRQHRSQRQRTSSYTGSIRSTRSRQSSLGTIRGAPHHNRVNIVLPQPLAPGLYINSQEPPQVSHTRVSFRDGRRSESRESDYRSGRVSLESPSSNREFHNTTLAYPPPVPPLPAGYSAIPSGLMSPVVSDPSTPAIASPSTPTSWGPLLSTYNSSPDHGPPPLPPPKDPVERRHPPRPCRASDGRHTPHTP